MLTLDTCNFLLSLLTRVQVQPMDQNAERLWEQCMAAKTELMTLRNAHVFTPENQKLLAQEMENGSG